MTQSDVMIVDDALEGSRLDKCLAEIMPESGLRLRRRLCDQQQVAVDGVSRKPGYKVRTGQTITISREEKAMPKDAVGVRVVRQEGAFAALYKPGGVHSAFIEGMDDVSVEGLLPELFPEHPEARLLNRLDFLTSGLLLVALSQAGNNLYLSIEDAGGIEKFYLARVKGRLDGMVTVKNGLDTDDRKKTRVLGDDVADERRWTEVTALSHDHENDTTLVRCLIMKGARHQIRAHLASIGHPILGDPLYGDDDEGGLRLHHERLEFSGFTAECEPEAEF